MNDNLELLAPKNAGEYLAGTPEPTLQWWRTTGRGPKYLKIGRRVFYRKADLEAFIAAGERTPERELA